MKAIQPVINFIFTGFLIVCIGVHLYGLATHFNNESTLSHIVHTVSYGICLFTFLKPMPFRTLLYSLAAVYPFLYHANCAWMSYSLYGKLNPICILVIIMMPLGAVWVWKKAA